MRWLKQQLRHVYQARRQLLNPHFQTFCSQQIAYKLMQSHHYQQAKHIALYHAFKGEVQTSLILSQALLQQKCCYLPVIQGDKLVFVKVDNSTRLGLNQYGIYEPPLDRQKQIPTYCLDLVLLPLVAFDKEGHRLGMGKGYYDKTFAFRLRTLKPKLVGLAYDFQRVTSIPSCELDVKLDCVVTEKRIYLPTKNQA